MTFSDAGFLGTLRVKVDTLLLILNKQNKKLLIDFCYVYLTVVFEQQVFVMCTAVFPQNI